MKQLLICILFISIVGCGRKLHPKTLKIWLRYQLESKLGVLRDECPFFKKHRKMYCIGKVEAYEDILEDLQ